MGPRVHPPRSHAGGVASPHRCSHGAMEPQGSRREPVGHACAATSPPCSTTAGRRPAPAFEHGLSWSARQTGSGLCARAPEHAADLRQQPPATPLRSARPPGGAAVGRSGGRGAGSRHVKADRTPDQAAPRSIARASYATRRKASGDPRSYNGLLAPSQIRQAARATPRTFVQAGSVRASASSRSTPPARRTADAAVKLPSASGASACVTSVRSVLARCQRTRSLASCCARNSRWAEPAGSRPPASARSSSTIRHHTCTRNCSGTCPGAVRGAARRRVVCAAAGPDRSF